MVLVRDNKQPWAMSKHLQTTVLKQQAQLLHKQYVRR